MSRRLSLRPRRFAATFAAAAALGGVVAGCGDKSTSADAGAKTTASSSSISVGKVGSPDSQLKDISKVCGDKPTTIALAWAFDGNAWRKLAFAMLKEYAKGCPSIKKVLYANANLNAQKSISDINSLVAQGVDVLIVYPDFGPAILPALRAATAKGVKVVPFAVEPKALGGAVGTDYLDTVSESTLNEGKTWGNWMIKALNGKGNVVFIGGTPGSPTGLSEFEGVKQAFAEAPGMKLLGNKIYWGKYDVAATQKLMAGLLTQYGSRIDGVIVDYGGAAVGAIRSFEAANRPLVPFATADQNNLGCLYEKLKHTEPKFQLGTVSSRNWVIYSALNKGLAAFQGKSDPEPSIFNLPIIEDSTGSMSKQQPQCDPSLPDDAILSAGVSTAQMKAILGS
jgi:ribose transport system substrate-binding protein